MRDDEGWRNRSRSREGGGKREDKGGGPFLVSIQPHTQAHHAPAQHCYMTRKKSSGFMRRIYASKKKVTRVLVRF